VFTQDDWYHLYQVWDKNLFQVLNYFNIFQSGKIDPLNFYRPLSTKLYFFTAYKLFGLNPLFYRIVNITLLSMVCFLIYKLAKNIFSKKIALPAAFFYTLNLANFTLISYLTKAEDLLFALFSLLCIYAFLKNKKIASPIFFIFSLMCRESALILPLGIALLLFILKQKKDKGIIIQLFPHLLILLIYIFTRSFIYGWPKDREFYKISLFGTHIAKNILKYLQWNLNITGLVKQGNALALTNLLALCFMGLISLIELIRAIEKKNNRRLFFFSIVWWFLFLSPVLFFKDHRDPWNLVISSFGVCLILAKISINLKKSSSFYSSLPASPAGGLITVYCLLFTFGLLFYSHNHWTVTRSHLVKKTYADIKNQCSNNIITISAPNQSKLVELSQSELAELSQSELAELSQSELAELKYSWYYDLGPKVLCNDKNLKVEYIISKVVEQ